MSWTCELTGKSRLKGNQISHSNIKTRKFTRANLSRRKWHIDELSRTFTLTLSSSALRTIHHRGGLVSAILIEREGNLSERLLGIRKDLENYRRTRATKAAPKKAEQPLEQPEK